MKRHEPDYFSLAAGLLFTLLGLGLAISAATSWSVDGRWIAPLILIVLGGGGVAASLSANRRAHPNGSANEPSGLTPEAGPLA